MSELNRLAVKGGSPQVRFDVQYTVSAAGAPQQPGYHQITVVKNDAFRSFVSGDEPVNGGTGNTGKWSTRDLSDPVVFAHEALHLAGLPDRYDDYYTRARHRATRPGPRARGSTRGRRSTHGPAAASRPFGRAAAWRAGRCPVPDAT